MGKALIISEQGEGEYTAKTIFDTDRLDTEKDTLAARLVELGSELLILSAQIIDRRNDVETIQHELDFAISQGEEQAALAAIVKTLQEPTRKLALLNSKKRALVMEKTAAEKRLAFLIANKPEPQEITMWAADYSEGLTGEVGTIEPNGTLEAPPIIYPNEIEGSEYDAQRDSIIQPIASSRAPAVYFNRAIFPAWQKWLPTYRIATITALTGDSCTVQLDAAISSQQSLDVNQAPALSNVPIEYMEQNGGAFEEDDRVVVKFKNQSFDEPVIIGFEKEPRPEEALYFIKSAQENGSESSGWNAEIVGRLSWDGASRKIYRDVAVYGNDLRDMIRRGSSLFYIEYLHNLFDPASGTPNRLWEMSIGTGERTKAISNQLQRIDHYTVTKDHILYVKKTTASDKSNRLIIYRLNRHTEEHDDPIFWAGDPAKRSIQSLVSNETHVFVWWAITQESDPSEDYGYYRCDHDFQNVEYIGETHDWALGAGITRIDDRHQDVNTGGFVSKHRIGNDRILLFYKPKGYLSDSQHWHFAILRLDDKSLVQTFENVYPLTSYSGLLHLDMMVGDKAWCAIVWENGVRYIKTFVRTGEGANEEWIERPASASVDDIIALPVSTWDASTLSY